MEEYYYQHKLSSNVKIFKEFFKIANQQPTLSPQR